MVDKRNIIRLILLTASFALIFINLYSPFGATGWFNISKLEFFIYSSLVILTGVCVVVISRVILYQWVKRGHAISLGNYLIWIMCEIISMAMFYTLYEHWLLNDPRPFQEIFKVSLLNTSLVLLLPYSVLWLYFSWHDKTLKLNALAEEENRSEEPRGMIHFKDDKGNLRFSVKQQDVLYLKGTDNYVTIYYRDQPQMAHFMIRNTLKQLEEELRPQKIIRCHRSYMANIDLVKLIERDKDGLHIRMDFHQQIDIPVSKSYMDDIFKLFT